MTDEASQFVDEYWNVHERGVELGRGGQGVVFRTRDPDVAVKLALDGDGRPVTRAEYVEKLRRVRGLPLPPALNLSAPMAVLRETAGYAMRLINGMVPFSHFWPSQLCQADRCLEPPAWLASLPPELADQLLCYRATGGLQRRLIALYKCSSVLARLHGAGLVYGDVSPANAYISQDLGSREVWLIDADNLRYETARPGPGVYTPRFGAPELVQGRDGGRPRTDCYAFAVMAFYMLTLLHPFIGALVEEGDEEDWASEPLDGDLDERAYAGLLPWILDAVDDRNRKDNGLIDLVLTEELRSLFHATFGPGRIKPWMRPTMFQWPVALARALDQTITCPLCGMSYYVAQDAAAPHCPFCDTLGPRLLLATACNWTGEPFEHQAAAWRLVRELAHGSASSSLPHRLLQPFSLLDGDRDSLEVVVDGPELRLRCCDPELSGRLAVACPAQGDDAFTEFEGAVELPLSLAARGFWLRVGGPSPRVLRMELRGEVNDEA